MSTFLKDSISFRRALFWKSKWIIFVKGTFSKKKLFLWKKSTFFKRNIKNILFLEKLAFPKSMNFFKKEIFL